MDLFFLKVRAIGVAIKVSLNGVPVISYGEGVGMTETLPANIWLRPAENRIEVTLDSPKGPPEGEPDKPENEPSEEESVEVFLFLHREGEEEPTEARRLAEFKYPNGNATGFPYTWSEQIGDRLALPPALMWTGTVPITQLAADDRQAIYQVVRTLSERLVQRNLDGAFDLMKFRYADEAQLEGKTGPRIERAVKSLWKSMLAVKDIRYVPLPFHECDFTIMGLDRLVFVSRNDGSPAIEFVDDAEGFHYGIDLFFGNVRDKWLVIR